MKRDTRWIEVDYYEAPSINVKIAFLDKGIAAPSDQQTKRRFPIFCLNLFRSRT